MRPSSTDTLLAAPIAVQLHLVLALLSVVVGTVIFLRAKGTASHRLLGRVWVVSMLVLTLVSFGIRYGGHFSFIHVLSVVTLVTVPLGWWRARQGHVNAHRMVMISTFSGLAIAGAFTLLPQRLLGQLVFG